MNLEKALYPYISLKSTNQMLKWDLLQCWTLQAACYLWHHTITLYFCKKKFTLRQPPHILKGANSLNHSSVILER